MILLDTHVLIWLLLDDRQLGRHARQIIAGGWSDNDVAVSAISFWEIALLCAKGRLELLVDGGVWRAGLLSEGLVEVAVTAKLLCGLAPFLICTVTQQTASSWPQRWPDISLSPPTGVFSIGPDDCTAWTPPSKRR